MTTINGTTINVTGINIQTIHKNVYSNAPGSSANTIYDMGVQGLQITLDGWEVTQSAYNAVIAQFMKSGAQTLIIYEGWEYRVYSSSINRNIGREVNYFPWSVNLMTEDPYQYSTDNVSRAKSVTVNNQTWTVDNAGNPIQNLQTEATIPDIMITADAVGDYSRVVETVEYTDATVYQETSATYVLQKKFSVPVLTNTKYFLKSAGCVQTGEGRAKITYSLNGAAEIILDEDNLGRDLAWTGSVEGQLNQSFKVFFYLEYPNAGAVPTIYNLYATFDAIKKAIVNDAVVYNTADTTIKCELCNNLYRNATLRLNTDDTGYYSYENDFSDSSYLDTVYTEQNQAYVTDHVAVSSNGWAVFDVDVKYPIVGVPTLNAYLYGFTGTPQLQIAAATVDGIPDTWYDITAPLVDGTLTTYNLDNVGFHLAGKSKFFYRLYAAAAESINMNYEKLDISINPSAASFPLILGNEATNTMRCDQDSGSAMSATITLIYSERRWG